MQQTRAGPSSSRGGCNSVLKAAAGVARHGAHAAHHAVSRQHKRQWAALQRLPSHCVVPRLQALGAAAQLAEDEGVVGVVIVDHGSRRAESNDMLVQFAELYRQVTGRQVVEPAHMELAEPTIAQAIDACVARGASKVIVAPYFLSRGRHIQEDIPALVADARQRLPAGVECVIAEPIGTDALMAQLIENRVRAAQQQVQQQAAAQGQ